MACTPSRILTSCLTSLRTATSPPVGANASRSLSACSVGVTALPNVAAFASLSDGLRPATSTRRLPLQLAHLKPPSPRHPGQALHCLSLPILRRPPPPQSMQTRNPAPRQPGQSTFSSGSGNDPVPPQARQGTSRSLVRLHSMQKVASSPNRSQVEHFVLPVP